MKLFRFYILFIVSALLAGAQPRPNAKSQPDAQTQTVVIRAGTLLDGKGHTLHNVLIVVQAVRSFALSRTQKTSVFPELPFTISLT